MIDYTTGNLINTGSTPTATTSTWNNGVYVNQLCFQAGQAGNCGPRPSVRPDGNINFSYGQTDLNQVININAALAAAGTGISVRGFSFGFNAKNGNGWDDGRQDYLSAYVKLYNSSGGLAANYDYTSQTNQKYNWTNFNFNETFTNPILASTLSTAQVGFIGRDNNFWAGNYGPEINNVRFSLQYSVDPCKLNPAYSPSCAGFSSVLESANLVPNPGAYAVYGNSVNNTFAINKAFEMAGTGLQIHGFKWGYVANANGPYCALDMWILGCWDNRNPRVTTNVNITSNTGVSLYSVQRNYTNSYNTTNYQHIFPSSRALGSLGSFNFTATTDDQAYVGQMWSRALYTPDQCMRDPLSSPTCPGYAKAMATQTATTTTTDPTGSTGTTITDPIITTGLVATTPIVSSTGVTSPTTSTASTTTATADVAQPVAITTSSSSSTTSAPAASTQTAAATSSTPTATNPQPKIGEVTTAGSQPSTAKSSSSSVSTSQVLSMVRAEQTRIGNLETSTAMAAVEQAQQVGTKTANEAQSIATTQQTQSMANAQAIASSTSPTAIATSQTSTLSQTGASIGLNVFSVQSAGIGIGLGRGPDLYALTNNQTQNFGVQSYTASTPIAVAMVRRDREESKAFEQNSVFEQKQSLSATNPLNNILNPPPMMPPPTPAPTGPSVNTRVKDNDAAGGVTIASIARQPQGFELYMGGMTDRPFYAPKEIYRGQRNVDNARAQRMLSGASDRLHQEMVDLQYNNKGN